MKRRCKIVHVQLFPFLTGVQNVTIAELENLENSIFEKHIICQSKGALTDKCDSLNIKVSTCKNFVREISIINDLKAFFWLYSFFRKGQFNVVHTHSSKTGVLGRIAARLAGVPLVIHTVHGFSFPAAKNIWLKKLYLILEWLGGKASHKIICLHDADRNICINNLKVNAENVLCLPNGIDIRHYKPTKDKNKERLKLNLDIPENKKLIGMVGRLCEQKNPNALLSAALNILKFRNDVFFIFIGDGELREKLEEDASEFSSNIRFLGWRNDTYAILKALDIFVLPSLWEGMPLAILEAMASGLPCVVSDIAGNNHLIENEKNGFLVDALDANMLTERLLFLIENEDTCVKMGKENRRVVEMSYDIQSRVHKISNLYCSLLKL